MGNALQGSKANAAVLPVPVAACPTDLALQQRRNGFTLNRGRLFVAQRLKGG